MVISLKDILRFFIITIISACAVFICTMFLNYNIDLTAVKSLITNPEAIKIYDATVLSGKMTVIITGCCLIATSVIMLLFFIKNYIDSHGKELGILKAIGHSNLSIAWQFALFGITILVGCLVGFLASFLYLPTFYEVQNSAGYLPEVKINFHVGLFLCLTILPSVIFSLLSVVYAYLKLNRPVLDLMKERREVKVKKVKERESKTELSFLKELQRSNLRSNKTLVFFIAFSAFCFSAMVQMSFSMNELASSTFAFMVITIGLTIAYLILFLSLFIVIKTNTKTIAMMRVYGYDYMDCYNSIFSGYRPFAYIGFVVGTVYQWAILKMMTTFVYEEIGSVMAYKFDFLICFLTLLAFVISYELIMFLFALRIKKISIKSIMLE